jgi:hypothetical protein
MKKPGYGRLFDGLNLAGAVLTALAALGVIASTTRLSTEHPYLLPLTLVLFLVGQVLNVLGTVGSTRIRPNPRDVLALIGLYSLLSAWDFAALVIGLPFILVTMILGPLMVIVSVLASVALVMYLVEGVVGYDLSGYVSVVENPFQAFLAVLALVVSVLVLRWHFGQHGSADWVIERAGDLIFNLRQQLQGMAETIIEQDGHD